MNLMIPYGRQSISDADVAAVTDVMRSPHLTQGPVVPAFEDELANTVGARYAVAVNSATSGLHLACLALDLGPGDYLWTTAITFVASANCGLYCGAQVDFVDIVPSTGLICVEALSNKLAKASREGKLPRIIVAVHLSGTSCNMKEISSLARRYNVAIVEDASHAIGGKYEGMPVGSCMFSDITVFSFHPVKIITTGEGGAATTNNNGLAKRMRALRSHGITKDKEDFIQGDYAPWMYEQQELGFNYRMTDMQAALGLSQLSTLDEKIRTRRDLMRKYREEADILAVNFLEEPKESLSAQHLAIMRLHNKCEKYHREVFEKLRSKGIGVQVHYSPVHLQPYYRKLGFSDGYLPNAEEYGRNAISIPMHCELSDEEFRYVINALHEIV